MIRKRLTFCSSISSTQVHVEETELLQLELKGAEQVCCLDGTILLYTRMLWLCGLLRCLRGRFVFFVLYSIAIRLFLVYSAHNFHPFLSGILYYVFFAGDVSVPVLQAHNKTATVQSVIGILVPPFCAPVAGWRSCHGWRTHDSSREFCSCRKRFTPILPLNPLPPITFLDSQDRSRLARDLSLKLQLEEGYAKRGAQQSIALKEARARAAAMELALEQAMAEFAKEKETILSRAQAQVRNAQLQGALTCVSLTWCHGGQAHTGPRHCSFVQCFSCA